MNIRFFRKSICYQNAPANSQERKCERFSHFHPSPQITGPCTSPTLPAPQEAVSCVPPSSASSVRIRDSTPPISTQQY